MEMLKPASLYLHYWEAKVLVQPEGKNTRELKGLG
jgi:hypothetical protein